MTRTLLVTGGIGSGKSLVCELLGRRGIPVYDFDSVTKELYDTDPSLLLRVVDALEPYSHDLLQADGKIDRGALASAVFASGEALAALEAVVHPVVLQDFENWRGTVVENDGARIVAAESAIALEKPLFRAVFDEVLVVDAPVGLRVQRVLLRDGSEPEAVEKRMRSQPLMNGISMGCVPEGVDYVIVNDGDEISLEAKLENILLKIQDKIEL